MAAETANVPNAAPKDNKSNRRKKTKGAETAASKIDVDQSPSAEVASSVNGANGVDAAESNESPFVKELTKNLRNLRKRLNNTTKVDQILAANPGKSLIELLNDKKINADQKQQAENKPAVESQIKSTEERLVHYKKFEDELQKRFNGEKEASDKSHQLALETAREEAYEKANTENKEDSRSKLLTLSRFLRAAAEVRQMEDKSSDNEAFEGTLLLVYGGDERAVDSIEKLVGGSEEIVPKTDGEPSGFTFKHIRDRSLVVATPVEVNGELEPAAGAEPEVIHQSIETAPESDPTLANASLTEIEQGDVGASTSAAELDGTNAEAVEAIAVPEAATIDTGAANAVAVAATSDPNTDPMASSISKDWTEVPRDPAETDNGLEATPAAVSNNALAEAAPAEASSWAEDVPAEAAVPAGDGFSQVPSKSRGRGRGGARGRGNNGDFRGNRGRGRGGGYRGSRADGEHRGRGRGGFRGGRGGAEGGQS